MLRRVSIVVIIFVSHFVSADIILVSGSYSTLGDALKRAQGASSEQKTKIFTQKLLNTPYNNQTLNGDQYSTEQLVINLNAMDCMTFIEYTEAFKTADNHDDFVSNLKKIRYFWQDISFTQRRHFFTDWAQELDPIAVDITPIISTHSFPVHKKLNLKNSGEQYIPGLGVKNRVIYYIPTRYVDRNLMNTLKTGDYIGIYSKNSGLDVTHVGIVIKEGNKVMFRHASSQRNNLKVSDIELQRYLQGKAGIIVLRSKLDYYTEINE